MEFHGRSSTIREWLATCQKHHQRCKAKTFSTVQSAARIVAIDAPVSGAFRLRLVRTADLGSLTEKYTVLSHCWGTEPIYCSTTRESLPRYEAEGIQFETLPKTFQEAVQITAAIGIKYIWIDSLCIIQDNVLDWENEAAKMGAIFRDGALTISATNSRDCHGGCGIATTFEPAVHFKGSYRAPLDFTIRRTMPMHTEVQVCLSTAPVNTRAWIFQESLLSRRILHATQAQFVWECATCAETEDGILHDDGTSIEQYFNLGMHISPRYAKKFTNAERGHKWEQDWWTAVQDYTRRRLGRPSDRYAAFAGAVRMFQDISNDEPVVGLWRRNLHLHLCWDVSLDTSSFTANDESMARATKIKVRRPSWTWMSYPQNGFMIHGPSLNWNRFASCADEAANIRITYQAEIVHVNVHWSGEPLISMPDGAISIWGICNSHSIAHYSPEQMLLCHHFDVGVPIDMRLSGNYEKLALVSYLFNISQIRTIYLLVQPVSGGAGYIRIGCFDEEKPRYLHSRYDQPRGIWKEITLV